MAWIDTDPTAQGAQMLQVTVGHGRGQETVGVGRDELIITPNMANTEHIHPDTNRCDWNFQYGNNVFAYFSW